MNIHYANCVGGSWQGRLVDAFLCRSSLVPTHSWSAVTRWTELYHSSQ